LSSQSLAALRRIGAHFISMGQTRLELASVELAQLRHSTLWVLVWSLLAALLAVTGSLFVAGAVVLYFWDSSPFLALLGCAFFYLVLACFAVRQVIQINQQQPPIFEATLAELGKDSEALKGGFGYGDGPGEK
jgi:uncharacterized membrane protein YqjE